MNLSPEKLPVSLPDIHSAESRIAGKIIRTPLVLCDAASERAGRLVYLKLENFQRTGAFKIRGALSKLTTFSAEERRRGVICASSGNHGLGVAYASRCFDIRCTVVLPENASPHKVSLLSKMGAEIVTYGITSDVRQQKVDELSREHGYVQVSPFVDPVLIAGQGTVGLEILSDLPGADEVYVPIGGGGLISGIAVAIKEQRPATRVIGVEPEHSNAMWEALRHDGPYALSRVDTIADGLAARITDQVNYKIVRHYVDDVVLVSDRDIVAATLFLLDYAKTLAEPSGAIGLAGILANPEQRGKAVAVISGGNSTFRQLEELRQRFEI